MFTYTFSFYIIQNSLLQMQQKWSEYKKKLESDNVPSNPQPVKYFIKIVMYFHHKTERYLCVHGTFLSVKFNKKLC